MDVGGSGINNSSLDDPLVSGEKSTEASLSVRKQCKENGCTDYFEVRGGQDLDPLLMSPVVNFCGSFDSSNSGIPVNGTKIDVGCGNTAVRLVSSGKTDNSVTIFLDIFLEFDKSPCPRRTRRATRKYKHYRATSLNRNG